VCDLKQASWNPCYYSRADAQGIGFDRVTAPVAASDDRPPNAVSQYMPRVRARFASLATVPDKYLLWFHHVPWTYRMRDGRTLWNSLVVHYDRGVSQIQANRREWAQLRPSIDPQRFAAVSADLDRQVLEAWWWRDASIAYWESLSKLPLPPGHSPPAHALSWYQAVHFDRVPGFLSPRIDPEILCVAGRGGSSCAQSSSSPPRH
jgi:alpha-glucuronidase